VETSQVLFAATLLYYLLGVIVLQITYRKPTVVIYKERFHKPETEPFAVVKAQRFVITKTENDSLYRCSLEDFFTFMGDMDIVSTPEGKADSYVLCWFDDNVEDFSEAFRRLTGVSFPEGTEYVVDQKGKRTYNAIFNAKHAKLE
jgi:hypothetical protein